MNTHVFLAEASQEGQIQQIARSFGVDWIHLIAQAISFGIVCALLYRFAYHPVLAMLADRRQKIADGLANAEKIKAELAKAEIQRQEMLQKAGEEADKLIADAHVAAARVQERETKQAMAAAEQIMVKAHEAAELEHDRMLVALKREVGRLVVQTTSAVTGKILTAEDQQRLAEETVKQVTV
jgi:F-type H+-transporting ATPase subunit b